MKSYFFYQTAMGRLRISSDSGYITGISFFETVLPDFIERETPLLQKMYLELEEYFERKRYTFDIPIKPAGTPFQQSVWSALLAIPYGETRSYKEIAVFIGNPAACRAVGLANNRNPIPIVIPCHRVIGANGALVGYAGGLDFKKELLALEQHGRNR
jgi:methylated-DNA-[protein]-cysteine S-methyltransferase